MTTINRFNFFKPLCCYVVNVFTLLNVLLLQHYDYNILCYCRKTFYYPIYTYFLNMYLFNSSKTFTNTFFEKTKKNNDNFVTTKYVSPKFFGEVV